MTKIYMSMEWGGLPKRIIPPILIYVIFGGMGDCGDM
jgi:hypothetical protein